MKRKIVIPANPSAQGKAEQRQPRERRTLGIRFDLLTGETVSGLR